MYHIDDNIKLAKNTHFWCARRLSTHFSVLVFHDNDSNYVQLLNRVGQPSLFNGRVHYILTAVYKSLNGLAP